MKKPIYVPMLRAKAGEFVALKNLSNRAKSGILPLLDIPENTSKAKVPKTDSEHLASIVESISSIWKNRPLILDAFSWSPNASTDEGEHIITYLQSTLEAKGVEVSPVIGYDRWDDLDYQAAISEIVLPQGRHFCLRLDDDALHDIIDIDYFEERVNEILDATGKTANEFIALIDLADLSRKPLVDVLEVASKSIAALQSLNFTSIIISGSSIPESINLAVKEPNTIGLLPRKEMLIWRSLYQSFPQIVFGDYGVRSSRSSGEVIAPDANGKIRYTIEKRFMISRGHSMRTEDKGAQVHKLAEKIISSEYYLGSQFSWGDEIIEKCAQGKYKGNLTNWISIDTNHHIELVTLEITEFSKVKKNVEKV